MRLVHLPFKKWFQSAVAGTLIYTQVLIYTHLHSCTTSTLMYDSDRCQPVTARLRFGTRARLGLGCGWVMAGLITAVTNSHDSHVDESRQSKPRRGWVTAETCRVPVPRLQANLIHPLCAGSAYWFPLLAWNQMQGQAQCCRTPERAPRPSGHRSGTSCAHILATGRYSGEVYNR